MPKSETNNKAGCFSAPGMPGMPGMAVNAGATQMAHSSATISAARKGLVAAATIALLVLGVAFGERAMHQTASSPMTPGMQMPGQ